MICMSGVMASHTDDAVSEHFFCDLDEVIKEREGNKRVLTAIDVLDFGKYKGKTLQEIHLLDPRYLIWLSHNTQDFIIDFSNFKD